MAGDDTACSGDEDLIKIAEIFKHDADLFDGGIGATGMGDEHAGLIRLQKILCELRNVFGEGKVHFAEKFLADAHFAVFYDDHRVELQGVCHERGNGSIQSIQQLYD